MPRYIDANEIKITAQMATEDGDVLVSLSDVRKAIEQTPTADVVEVVRCKECKYHFPPPHQDGLYAKCSNSCLHMKMTDFCSYGERKEQG